MRLAGLLLSSFSLISICFSQPSKKKNWDVAEAHGPHKEVSFSVDEGTWMNLDVSPDGQEIVFDLLGDIYLLPISGGKARLVSGGLPYEIQPRFSPDGSRILFTSDRGGGDNIWIMNKDGSDQKQLTKESFRLLNNAVWSPDGQYFVARKHFTGTRSLGAGEMWLYHVTGGSGIQLTKRNNDQLDSGEPFISPDGRYVYFSEDISGGSIYQYNKDPNGQIYGIKRYDRELGKLEFVVSGAGGACRPTISPDGNILAYVKRVRTKSVLYLHDLNTGEEWPIFDGLTKDQQETWAIFGVYPNFAWMPDGQSIIVYGQGKIHRVDIESYESTVIPFEADVKQIVEDAVLFRQEVAPDEFEAKMIRHATTGPDGKWLAFQAAGHIYLKELPEGEPKRLTSDTHLEFEPSFSPDGKSIVYTSWADEEMGSIYAIEVAQAGQGGKKLTKDKGFYFSPRFNHSGDQIVFRKGRGNSVLGNTYSKQPGIYVMSSNGGSMTKVHDGGASPRFSKDGKKIYFEAGGGLRKFYRSLDLETKTVQTLFTSTYGKQFTPSPNEEWLAFTELFNAFIIPFPKTGKEFSLSSKTRAVPIKRVSRDAGTSLHWSGDSKSLHWMLGPEYFSRDIQESFTFVEGAPDSLPAIDSTGISVGLTLKTDVPDGQIALVNARIITMKGEQVIDNGYVLVKGNTIQRVAKGSRTFGEEIKVIDCEGKTIIPGLIDVHSHMGVSYNGISPQQQWSYFANLAYGITTTHDPSNLTEMVFSQSEMVEAGVMIGPRVYSTGTILYGADGDFKAVINSYEDALSHLRRLKAVGAFSVKSYNQPRRDQRQQVIKAARKLKMMVYPEGGSTFLHNMTMILDGHTGIEHSIPVNPPYSDVIQLWSKSKTAYTPTLIVGYGGMWGENYWYQKTNVWEKEHLLTFTPRAGIDARSRRREMLPEEEWETGFIENSKGCKALLDAGTKVQLGAHGQLEGLGAHWELWMLQQGGMTNHEALRAATLHGAEYIGMGHALGSIEKGKLADLVILEKNPLEDIKNTEYVQHVMKNGRLYEAATMNEIGNYNRKRLPFYWEHSRSGEAFDWHGETHGFMTPKCSCVH